MVNETSFANIRKAHRYVVAYQKRMLDALSQVDAGLTDLGFTFRKWGCIHHSVPCRPGTRPFGNYWTWDFVPFHAAVFEWGYFTDDEKQAGNVFVFVEHVADTAFETHMESDRGEPDPLKFADGEGETLFRAHWVKLLQRASDEEWRKSWTNFVKDGFGAESVGEPWPLTPVESHAGKQNDRMLVGGFAVRAEDVATPEAFRTNFIERLRTQVGALLPSEITPKAPA